MIWDVSLLPSPLSRIGLTPSDIAIWYSEFDSILPIARENRSSALPPVVIGQAIPRYISRRTSYLRVRLAYHL